MSAIDFQHVDVIFGKQSAAALGMLDAGHQREQILAETGVVVGVADASLTVEEGQICVLMGLSGSGKSSLLRCVNGLNKVTRGQLQVNDGQRMVDVAACSAGVLRELRMNRIAMVFQQFGLLPWRTVRDNVAFGLEIKGMARSEIEQIVADKLTLVHLEPWADKQVAELSGGMQQRVGLARAFATDAEILLMDEPFSALDPLIRTHLQDELLELQDRLKKTILFVSHDLDEALKLGNHIVIMDGGHIVQQGGAEKIIFKPANEYVRRFVANMNPLQVLKAGALMTPVSSEHNSDVRTLDIEDDVQITLDAHGKLRSVQRQGQSVDFIPINQADADLTGNQILCADAQTRMRELVAARHRLPLPILVIENERLIGTVSERDIYTGLLRQGG